MAFQVSRHGYLVWIPTLEGFVDTLRRDGKAWSLQDAAEFVHAQEQVLDRLVRQRTAQQPIPTSAPEGATFPALAAQDRGADHRPVVAVGGASDLDHAARGFSLFGPMSASGQGGVDLPAIFYTVSGERFEIGAEGDIVSRKAA